MSYTKAARRLAQASVIAAALGVAAAAPAAATPAPGHGAPGTDAGGSAYGLTATGPVPVPTLPAVQSPGGEVRKSLLRENHTKMLDAGALNVKAARDRAHAQVADLRVPDAGLLAQAVTARCQAGRGSARLAGAMIGGRPLAVDPPPNTVVPVDVPKLGRVALTLNKQWREADGRLTVTAIALDLPVAGRPESLRVASATCGRPSKRHCGCHGHHDGPKTPESTPPADPKPAGPAKPVKGKPVAGTAPRPVPVKGDLPVTG
ncbi:choice-of-anchor P family protein [Actinomadura parmotrematis]|uniref:DUF5667 domain-containing protein n=1 Tax=Actinomadura parmotrematis TaxID=2864039 RepID=A0ABS7FNY8_9ACTN|nr:choice-of-anchor P family protein [Actinomadura parmotrematis]MBW8482021.1 hypothetical protein [Actinomadura parmotrematis]